MDDPQLRATVLIEYRLSEVEKEICSVRADVERTMAETKGDIRALAVRMDRRDGQALTTMVGALIAAGGVIVTMLTELTRMTGHP